MCWNNLYAQPQKGGSYPPLLPFIAMHGVYNRTDFWYVQCHCKTSKSWTIPKSHNFKIPSNVIKIFSGFTWTNENADRFSLKNRWFILHPYEHSKENVENPEPKEINEKIEYRKQRHPLEFPNIGSIFKNVPFETVPSNLKEELSVYIKDDPFPVVPSAKLIFLAGLKGKRVGNVMVSEKHTNFIVNLGEGRASEVVELISLIKNKIKDDYNIFLQEEIMYVGGDFNER